MLSNPIFIRVRYLSVLATPIDTLRIRELTKDAESVEGEFSRARESFLVRNSM